MHLIGRHRTNGVGPAKQYLCTEGRSPAALAMSLVLGRGIAWHEQTDLNTQIIISVTRYVYSQIFRYVVIQHSITSRFL